MIDVVESRPDLAGSVPEQVEGLLARLPAAEALAEVERLFGVLPLLATFFGPETVEAGSLGLFTPTPELGWAAAAVDGEPVDGGLLLRGQVRLSGTGSGPGSGGTLVLARLADGGHRLAWIDRGASGWLVLDGAAARLVSRPVSLERGSDLCRRLAEYAGVWALAAALVAREGVRALRRAARTTVRNGAPFSSAQGVAMEIAGVEIETEMTVSAARRRLTLPDEAESGLAVAAAASRVLSGTAGLTARLRDELGLEIGGPLAGPGAAALTAGLGGPLMLEFELARALGIGEPPAEVREA